MMRKMSSKKMKTELLDKELMNITGGFYAGGYYPVPWGNRSVHW